MGQSQVKTPPRPPGAARKPRQVAAKPKRAPRAKKAQGPMPSLLKDAILKAAELAGGGGPEGLVKYLAAKAEESPSAFMTLLGKVMPLQVAGDATQPLMITMVERRIVEASLDD